MGQIKREEELNLKKDEHVLYSESYEVNFWQQDKTTLFWKPESVMYFAKTKGEHEYVHKRWNGDYAGLDVKFISINYQ